VCSQLCLPCVQRARTEQDFWIQMGAVFVWTFYLSFEALSTHQIAYAAITELLAVTALDYLTKPWEQAHLLATVVRKLPGDASEGLTALLQQSQTRKL
jgi:hypothetical protein